MKRTTLAVLLLLVVGACAGCSKEKSEVMSDGSKWFGKRVLTDGTQTAKRIEYPSGQKDFDEILHPGGTHQIARVETPDGRKEFDVTVFPDGTIKAGRVEWPHHVMWFDVAFPPDGTKKIARAELPNGEKNFDVTVAKDGTAQIKRLKYPDGKEEANVTLRPDGTRVFYTAGDLGGIATPSNATTPLENSPEETEEEIARFLTANIPDSDDSMRISNRAILIKSDYLVVYQDFANSRTGELAHSVIKVRVSEVFLAKAAGTEVDVTCGPPRDNHGDALTLNRLVDCVHLSVGAYGKGMTGIKITNVPQAVAVADKLNGLILLHIKSRYRSNG